MDEKIYMQYIANYIKYTEGKDDLVLKTLEGEKYWEAVPKKYWKNFLTEKLGKKLFKDNLDKVKKLAYLLRRTEILGQYISEKYFSLTRYTNEELLSIITDVKDLYTKHSLKEPSVDTDATLKGMKKYFQHISDLGGLSDYKSILDQIFEAKLKAKTTKTKTTKAKVTKAKTTKTKTTKTTKAKTTKAKTTKTKTTGVKIVKGKKCLEYTRLELIEIAKSRKGTDKAIKNYSKMKKAELCEALKIKN